MGGLCKEEDTVDAVIPVLHKSVSILTEKDVYSCGIYISALAILK